MKYIKGFEGRYSVNKDGNVFSHIRGRFLKPRDLGHGYLSVLLSRDGFSKNYKIHRLVALTYLGEDDRQIDHLDGNPKNNKLENLEYVSHRENCTRRSRRKKKSGLPTGVFFEPRTKRYYSRIRFGKKIINLGTFDTPGEASDAYEKALP